MALIVQVPKETVVSTPPLVIVQTPAVVEVKVTALPLAPPVAVSVGAVPKACEPGLVKVMVCAACVVLKL